MEKQYEHKIKNDSVVYCDFDGTFIDGDLENEFVHFLIKNNKLGAVNYLCAFITIPINSIRKAFGYGDVIKAWSVFKTEKEILDYFDSFLQNFCTVSINNSVLDKLLFLKDNGYKMVLLTASNEILVDMFLKKTQYDDLFDSIIGSSLKSNKFFVDRSPFGKDKCQYVNGDYTVGIANEYADRFYLLKCDKVYINSKDKRLLKIVSNNNWEVI